MSNEKLYLLGICFSEQLYGVSTGQMLELVRNDQKACSLVPFKLPPSIEFIKQWILKEALAEVLVIQEIDQETYALTSLGVKALFDLQIKNMRACLATAIEDLNRLANLTAKIR